MPHRIVICSGGGLQAAVFLGSSLWLEMAAWRPPPRWKFQVSAPPAVPPHSRKKLRLSLATSTDSSVSVVGRALLPVGVLDGQECPSYEDHGCVNWRLLNDLLVNEVSAQAPPLRLTHGPSAQTEQSWVTVFPVFGSRNEGCISLSGISTKRLWLSLGCGICSCG